jgi:hypothetical protein
LSPPQKVAPTLSSRIYRAHGAFAAYAKSRNNGVKEGNVLQLLLPIGVPADQIDLQWLLALDAWGASRGEVAHNAKRVQTSLDPLEEWKTVGYLVSGLKEVDVLLERLSLILHGAEVFGRSAAEELSIVDE